MKWLRVFSTEAEARTRIAENKPQLLILQGKRICLARFQGRWYAVQDACTHNGESLSKGVVNYVGEIVCPWHHYRFDMRTGRACDSSCSDLESFPIRIDDAGFFVGV